MADPNEKIWLMAGLIIGSIFIVCVVFYLSRTQEWCCGIHKLRTDMEHEDDDALAEMRDPEKGGVKIPTKVFQDSQRQGRMNQDDISDIMHQSERHHQHKQAGSSNGTVSSSSVQDSDAKSQDQGEEEQGQGQGQPQDKSSPTTFEQEKHLAVMATAPRCVLCSKKFTIGEDVTHSNNPNCGHEFHELCLRKHWQHCNKKSGMVGKCPVCKVPYVIAKRAPSQHFSIRSTTTTTP